MANARGREIDNTHLSIDTAEKRGLVHRDYIAHCHRWSHVVKYLYARARFKSSTILDIGCGKEVPLAKLLYSNRMTSAKYIGVDVNKLNVDFNFGKMAENITLVGKCDFADSELDKEYGVKLKSLGGVGWVNRPTVITCFEVLEHVEPSHSISMLKKIREIMDPDGIAFISTPCFNGSAAANHVNEMRYEALGKIIQELGFGIEAIYGTFASQFEIEPLILKKTYESKFGYLNFNQVYEKLKQYYDSNVLSTIFAPLFPEASRNALWVLTADPQESQDLRFFPDWDDIKKPWTSSNKWEELKNA